MAPEPMRAHALRAAFFAITALLCASPAHALRVVNYNIMFYPSVNVSGRNPHFRQVMSPLGAEIVVVQELNSPAGVDSFRNNVLNVIEPGQWLSAPYTNGPDSNNGFFYKPSRVSFLGTWVWIPPANLRQVNCYRVRPQGYSDESAELRIYSVHLKAGNTSADEARRLTDAIGIRDSMNTMPPGTHAILTGDFNAYRSSDPAIVKFLEPQADNDGRVYDPLNAIGTWQDNSIFAAIHTQCPSTTAYRPSGSYSGGGIDDRFDLFLPTYNMNDTEGMDLLVSTYIPVGNDGLHLNKSITDAPILPADSAYARSLWWASDHLPIRVDIEVPSMIAVAGGPLSFPTVILGAPLPGLDVQLSNPASVPADELDYSFTGTPGFQVPGGSFEVGAGAPAVSHQIRMGTGSSGNKVGTATIQSDAPDGPVTVIDLSGTVLRHASPSLDGASVALAGTVDFGTEAAGNFSDHPVDVFNQAYDAVQARLSLDDASIAGGDGRFTIVGGFNPSVVTDTPASFSIHFDDAGAALDLDYDATLTFASTDEPLPGASARPDLTVALHARVSSGSVSAPIAAAPTVTRLYSPAPNPLVRASTVRFDLATAAPARLDLFDLGGRHVLTLADRPLEAGRYSLSWDGHDQSGAKVGPGVYFARLSLRGFAAQTVRLAVVR